MNKECIFSMRECPDGSHNQLCSWSIDIVIIPKPNNQHCTHTHNCLAILSLWPSHPTLTHAKYSLSIHNKSVQKKHQLFLNHVENFRPEWFHSTKFYTCGMEPLSIMDFCYGGISFWRPCRISLFIAF